MSKPKHIAIAPAGEYENPRGLAERLGSAQELTSLSHSAYAHQLTRIHSLPALREFLERYRDEVLAPHELRCIARAAEYAGQNHLKELLALDEELGRSEQVQEFQLASRHVGKRQLNRMRPMKDLRVLQRYRDAVNEGKAYGWHTLVYGLVLSTYSIPVRQGLLHYGRQTLGGFIQSAARPLDLSEDACIDLQNELSLSLPPLIQQTLAGVNGNCIKLLS